MRKTLIGLCAALLGFTAAPPAMATPATVIVQSDGTTAVDSDNPFPVICISGCTGGGGGGGGAVTAAAGAYATGFSPDFGTLVSPATGSLLDLETRILSAASAALAACSGTPCTTQIGNVSLTDGATNTTKATVKAASTAPATTDTALVVTQSPNPGTSPCSGAPIPINQTTSTDLKTFTNLGRLCSIYISNATSTQGWSLANGTGTLCATNINYLIGGSGGTTQGSFVAANDRTVLVVSATANHLCLIQSGSTNLSGFITYSDAP